MEGTDGRYTVRDGDTLQSIAATHWGDASLWYLLAEANGLTGKLNWKQVSMAVLSGSIGAEVAKTLPAAQGI